MDSYIKIWRKHILMKGATASGSITLRFENYTWRSGSVKALRTDYPTLRTAERSSFKTSAALTWTDRLKNEDKTAWVNDGKTLPVAFGDNFFIEIKYEYLSVLYTYNQIIVNKTTFAEAAKQISNGIFIQSGITDDWGIDVFYNGSILYLPFSVYNDSGETWLSFEVVTTSFVAPKTVFNEEVLDSEDVGDLTNTVVDVISVGGTPYSQITLSQGADPILVSNVTVSSSNGLQALAPIQIKTSDVNGNESAYYEIPTVDPYQFQNVTNLETDFLMDNNAFIEVAMVGDSATRISMNYGEIELESLEDVNYSSVMSSEDEEIDIVYSNFGGIKVEEKKNNNIAWIVVAILALLYIDK